MSIEDELKEFIVERYGSASEFCKTSDMPTSTYFTIMRRGIGKTSTTTMMKMCDALGIDVNALAKGKIEVVEKNRIKTYDIIDYISDIEKMHITFEGDELSEETKKLIIYASKIAVITAVKKRDGD